MSDLLDILGFGESGPAPKFPKSATPQIDKTGSLDSPKTGSLEDAREYVMEGLNKGITCPCCDQYAKRYKLKLSSGMAATLCWIWANHQTKWVHVPNNAPDWVVNSRSYPKMVMWGLLESKPKQDGHPGRTSGVWRVTPIGADFVRGLCEVPRYAYNYNGSVDKMSQETTDIHASLGDCFDYAELMTETME